MAPVLEKSKQSQSADGENLSITKLSLKNKVGLAHFKFLAMQNLCIPRLS